MKTAKEWHREWCSPGIRLIEDVQRDAVEACAQAIEDHEGDALPTEKLAAIVRALAPVRR